jgi:biofilm PGA synthesis protein PgaD
MPAAANDDIPLRERPPVVEAPGLLITFSRSGILITSALLAAFAIWAMVRVALFSAWLLGLRTMDHHFIALGGFAGVVQSVAGFFTGVLVLCGGLFSWAFYNWVRFHGPDRRREPRAVTDEKVADHYGLPRHHVWKWQFERRLIAHHDERGVVTGAVADVGSWVRDKDRELHVIKPNAFDILYLSMRSRQWRRQAAQKISGVR